MYSKYLIHKYFVCLLGPDYIKNVKFCKYGEERVVDLYYPEYSLAIELKETESNYLEKKIEYGVHFLCISNPKQLLTNEVTDWLVMATGISFKAEHIPYSVVQKIKYFRQDRPKYSANEKQHRALERAIKAQEQENASNAIRQL